MDRVGHAPGEHFVQHHSEGIDIAALIEGACGAFELLRGRVGRRSHEIRGERGGALQIGEGRLSQAEVQHVRLTRRVHENVGGLQIAVENALGVGMVYRGAYLQETAQDGPAIGTVLSSPLADGHPCDPSHGEDRRTAPTRSLQDLHDVRVIERRDGSEFSLEAAAVMSRGERSREHAFDGCRLSGAAVTRPVDDPLRPAPDFLEDLEFAQRSYC